MAQGLVCPQCGKNTLQPAANGSKYICKSCSVIVVEAIAPFNPGKGKGNLCPFCKTSTLFEVASQITSNVTTKVLKCNNPDCSVVALIPVVNIKVA